MVDEAGKVIIEFSMDPELLVKVERYAARLGIERSQLITVAIEAQMNLYDKITEILAKTIIKVKEN